MIQNKYEQVGETHSNQDQIYKQEMSFKFILKN